MKKYTVRLTDAENKAMATDVLSNQEWIDNVAYNKARQCIDSICDLALADNTHTILTIDEKQLIALELNHRDIWFIPTKDLPVDIKETIVLAARVISGAERNALAEAETP